MTPGIDPDALPARLAPRATAPGDARYEGLRHTYSSMGTPALVITAEDAEDVQAAVELAARQRLPVSLRSGGHGPSTNCGGLVIDLGGLREVGVLDRARGLVRTEAGARWGEVAEAIDGDGMALTSGDYGDVGVGGVATVGGIGLLARRQGLTIDRVRAVEMVLADGTLVRADERENADLLWAARGAGGAFGVATAFELEAELIGEVGWATLAYRATDLPGLLERWAELVGRSPRELTSFLYVFAREGAPLAQATAVYAGDDAQAGERALAPFAELAPVLDRRGALVRYAALLGSSRLPHTAQMADLTTRGGLLDHVTAEIAVALADLVTSGAADVLQLRSVGGAVNDPAPEATAYAHRHQRFSLVVATWQQGRAELDAAWDATISREAPGTYLNFEGVRDDAVVRRAYPAPTLARLQALKRRYDPTGLFDASLAIPKAAPRDAPDSPPA